MKTLGIEQATLAACVRESQGLLTRCCDSGQPIVVELPDHRLVAIQPLHAHDEDDTLISDLIETNADFRALVEKSAASSRKPFAPKNAGAN